MCNLLLQVYTCGDEKPICVTPCTFALTVPQDLSCHPALDPRTPKPIRDTMNLWSFDTAPTDPVPPYASQTPTPNAYAHGRGHGHHRTSTMTSTSTIRHSASTASTASVGHRTATAQEAQFCPYLLLRRTPISRYPCLKCYMQPQYSRLRTRWMQEYRGQHPGGRPQDWEIESGVGLVAERAGLVNVMRGLSVSETREGAGSGERRGLGIGMGIKGGDGAMDGDGHRDTGVNGEGKMKWRVVNGGDGDEE
ncbi:hypothetical protein BCR34DRAFT_667769 [Clohesyomyces aquaticus]|uniref:Uncharacterized protein n=1 Tax=Clohesyomyces aquaticus TaxID=1231657 RepID=A0A1Y1YW18_9PLEO|nr:hypothetical protein BCR34DRAFT_667769 [Clohesyomyces aquaticus]